MKFIVVALLFTLSFSTFSQYQDGLSPKKSPKKTVTSTFGFAELTIAYGSPKQKGRDLFGKLVPFGEVWRLGADEATTLSVTSDFMIGDVAVKAGKYAMFLRPQATGDWDFILNSQSEQWGAYDYSDSLDILVFKVSPIDVGFNRENLTIDFEEYAKGSGELSIHWGKIRLAIPFSIDLMEQFMATAQAKIDGTPKSERWAALLQASEYLTNQGQYLDQAKDWIKEAIKLYGKEDKWQESANDYYEGHLLWTQAKIYAGMGKTKKALKIAKVVAANTAEKSFYTFENDATRENIDAKMSIWKD